MGIILITPIMKLFIIISLAAAIIAEPADHNESASDCNYSIHIKTGSLDNAGSDSVMSLNLLAFTNKNDDYGSVSRIQFDNIRAWGGHMSAHHNYFESGKLDVFSGTGPCLGEQPCSITLISDGTGEQPAWYVEYVAVSTDFGTSNFSVDRWLSTDFPPYLLNATVFHCLIF